MVSWIAIFCWERSHHGERIELSHGARAVIDRILDHLRRACDTARYARFRESVACFGRAIEFPDPDDSSDVLAVF